MTENYNSTPEELIQYFDMMSRANENLKYLIGDLLDVTALEKKKITIIPVVFSLHDLLNEIIEGSAEKSIKKGLSLTLNYNYSIPNQLYEESYKVETNNI